MARLARWQYGIVEEFEQGIESLLIDSIDYSDDHQCMSYFYKIICNAHKLESISAATSELLDVALKRFDCDIALVIRPISETVSEVLGCSESSDRFYIGQHISIREDLCGAVLAKNETVVQNQPNLLGGDSVSMAYNGSSVETYLGTPLNCLYQGRCILCLISTKMRDVYFNSHDETLLENLAEGIACMIDLQKSQAQRKPTDLAAFADGSVKTLDEYLEQARLPEMLGVPARVLEVLQSRIGQQPLGISFIAEELNLSKRTLQRRLQQQDVNFAELRDQVRFHHSIDYLIKQHMSIDSISSALDFSDRTSFTNAFKRWTGLSPSTFRKLFRDYV